MLNVKNSTVDGWAQTPFLEKLASTSPSLIYIFNQESQSNEYANRSVGDSLGYTVQEIQDMGDALFVNLCHPEDLPLIPVHLETIRQMNDGEVAQLEYRMKHKDGHWVWLLGYDTIFERNESGQVVRHLGTAIDISRQKFAQEQAEAEKRAADAANAELRSFAYSMSHDMKGPSNTLHFLLRELQEDHGDSFNTDARELMDMSLNTVARMQTLLEDVVNYTQVVGQSVEFSDVDLNVILSDILGDLHAEISQNGVQVSVDHLPIVRGSHTLLRMLFQNLIGNALKYHPEDSKPVISVSCTLEAHDNIAFIHVKDEGIGIAPEHQSRIFGMFKRLHVNEDYPGSGLGLAICKRVALSHGGDIKVTSALNQGATFTIRLKTCG